MKEKITVIYTDDTKPRRYIYATSRRTGTIDTTLAAELTTDPNKAHDFGSVSNAKTIIQKIHNPYEREYLHERIEVDRNRQINIDQSREMS